MFDAKEFVRERNEAIFSFDVPKFRNFIRKYFPDKLDEFEVFTSIQKKGVMAKMVLCCTDVPEDVVLEAKEILKKNGWSECIYG